MRVNFWSLILFWGGTLQSCSTEKAITRPESETTKQIRCPPPPQTQSQIQPQATGLTQAGCPQYQIPVEPAPEEVEEEKNLGAKVGTEELIAAVEACVTAGTYYDRGRPVAKDFLDDACTKFELSKMNCTKRTIDKHFDGNADYLASFETVLETLPFGTTKDQFQIDQCITCPKGTGVAPCQEGSGEDLAPPTEDKIVIIFVMEKASKIQSKSIPIPTKL